MALNPGEQPSGGWVIDADGRQSVSIQGGAGAGGGGSAVGSEGAPAGALPAKTLWIAGANGAVLQGLQADASGRLRTVVEGTPAVSVSNFPASQPVTGPLTDAQLRAAAVPVSGTVTANVGTGTQPVSGSVALDAPTLTALETISVANFPATQPVSGNVGVTGALPAGANNIGDVDVLTAPDVVNHDAVNTLPTAQIGGNANSEKAPDAEPAAVAAGDRVRAWHGLRGEYITRDRKVPTYSVVYRLATITGRNVLNFTFTANADKQWATLHHAASATKLIRIHRVAVVITANTVAGQLTIDLRRITGAPATGNPAITPKLHSQANPVTEAVCLALPSTGGTEDNSAASYSTTELNLAAGAALTSISQNQGLIELLNQGDLGDSAQSIELRPGVLEGVAVCLRHTAASATTGYVRMVYTEETL